MQAYFSLVFVGFLLHNKVAQCMLGTTSTVLPNQSSVNVTSYVNVNVGVEITVVTSRVTWYTAARACQQLGLDRLDNACRGNMRTSVTTEMFIERGGFENTVLWTSNFKKNTSTDVWTTLQINNTCTDAPTRHLDVEYPDDLCAVNVYDVIGDIPSFQTRNCSHLAGFQCLRWTYDKTDFTIYPGYDVDASFPPMLTTETYNYNVTKCRNTCNTLPFCVSFSHNVSNDECRLFTIGVYGVASINYTVVLVDSTVTHYTKIGQPGILLDTMNATDFVQYNSFECPIESSTTTTATTTVSDITTISSKMDTSDTSTEATTTETLDTISDLPSTTYDLQSTSSEILSNSSETPSSSPELPSTSSEIPTSTSELPTTTSELPTTTSELPTTTSELTTTTSELPTKTSEQPTTTSELPTTTSELTTTTSGLPTTTSEQPTTTELLTTTTELPTTTTELPTTTTELPTTTTELPTTITELPTTTTELPTTTTELPTTTTELPTTTTELPTTTTELPTTTTELPTTTTELPTTTTELPTTTTELPTTTTELPTTTTELPTTTTELPTTTTELPTTTTELPTTTTELPTTTTTELPTTTSELTTTTTTTTMTTTNHDQSTSHVPTEQGSTTISSTSVSSTCFCTDYCIAPAESTELAEDLVDVLVRNLTVNPRTTYKYKLTLTCADDERPSSRAIGVVALGVTCAVFGTIILSDVEVIVNMIRTGK